MSFTRRQLSSWIVIIAVVTVVYGLVHIGLDRIPVVPVGKPPIQNIREYSGYEKCLHGLSFFIAINNLWLSISTVPGSEKIQGGHCTEEGYDPCGATMIMKFSLTI